MIIGGAGVGLQCCGRELRVCLDEVFWKSRISQYRSVDSNRNVRQVGVDAAGLAVVQRAESIRESLIVPVGEIVLKLACRGGAKLLRSRLRYAVENRAN